MSDSLEKIRKHAQHAPDSVALSDGTGELTYSELDLRARQLAGALRESGVKRETLVALCCPRGFTQVVASLAVMRAGGAYLPLDPGWPQERIRSILSGCEAMLLIASGEFAELAPAGMRVLSPGEGEGCDAPEADEADFGAEDSLAYVIYTSGSTGAPKGVEITRGNLDHLIAWHVEAFGVTARDRASHLAGLGFDASVWEVWPYLAAGACVSMVDDVVRTSPELLREWMVRDEITMAFVPTTLAESMMLMEWPEGTKLRFLLTGGDRLHHGPKSGQRFAVVNNYGPTECTVVATSVVIAADEVGMPSIGRGIGGNQVYMLDTGGRDARPGEMGELYVGGPGVGRGYRGDAEQTARAFVAGGEGRGRLYRTGDYGSVLPDGRISFEGRVDGQVKIRGQRLEVEEIVCVLNRHRALAFSTVMVEGDGEEKHLVAYVVMREGCDVAGVTLREFLLQWLPSYMVPAVFVRLEALPLNASGKVDVRMLPGRSEREVLAEGGGDEAESVVEETILELVRTLLKTGEVGVEDDFFLIGGHSLMGTRLVMRIREAFGVAFSLRDLFQAKTVRGLAAHVENLLMEEVAAMSEEEAAQRMAE